MKEEKPDFSNIKISGVHTAEELDSTTQNTPYIPVNNNLDNGIDMPVLKNEVVANNVLEQPSFNAQEHVVQQSQYQIPQQNINGIVDNGSDVVIDGPMPNDDKGTFIDKLNDILNDKKKFRRVLIVCVILFALIYYGGGTLINMMMASKLQYNVIYNGTYEDANIGLVFRDNGKCDMDVFGLIDCEYEEKYGLYAVGFGKGLYRYIWLFKVTGNDKIKLIYETTYLTTSDDDLKKLDITFTTDGETRDQLDFEEYLSSAIDSAKKTSTTTVTTTVNSKVYGVSSVNISNYDSNRDYSNNFFVENNILYTIEPDAITKRRISSTDNVSGLVYVNTGNDYYLFMNTTDGKFYYINNRKDSSQVKYEQTFLRKYNKVVSGKFIDGTLVLNRDDGFHYTDVFVDRGLNS